MGLKHLRLIENFLKTQKDLVSFQKIRKEAGNGLSLDYNTLKDSLNYLLEKKIIEKKSDKYGWKNKRNIQK